MATPVDARPSSEVPSPDLTGSLGWTYTPDGRLEFKGEGKAGPESAKGLFSFLHDFIHDIPAMAFLSFTVLALAAILVYGRGRMDRLKRNYDEERHPPGTGGTQ